MWTSAMRLECRLIVVDFVEQHAVTLALGYEDIEALASGLIAQ